jgi:hypothetical protein
MEINVRSNLQTEEAYGMKFKLFLASMLVLGLAFSSAYAEETKEFENAQDGSVSGGDPCPVDGYKGGVPLVEGLLLETNVEYLLGPYATVPGGNLVDVILDVGVEQTWVGDLVVELYYDPDCQQQVLIGPVSALCRPNLVDCPFPGSCCGCSGNVLGTYRFADGGAYPLGEDPNCFTDIGPGCYNVAPESPGGFAQVFAGYPKGGCFWLRVGDGAAGDDTFLRDWAVWTLNEEATATEQVTWGQIKNAHE